MIKIMNKYYSMKVGNQVIPAGTIVEVSANEYQELSFIYQDITRIVEKKEIKEKVVEEIKEEPKEVIVEADTFKIEKKKKKNK